jgi:hypothetical protein
MVDLEDVIFAVSRETGGAIIIPGGPFIVTHFSLYRSIDRVFQFAFYKYL